MDSTIIQEIANQLGMAVDQAGQFITEQLPNYASMKALQILVPMIVLLIIAIIALVCAIISFEMAAKKYDKEYEDWNKSIKHIWDERPEVSDSISGTVCVVSSIVFGFSFIIFIVYLMFNGAGIIGWSNYPEAMLLDMALKAVG